MFYCRKPVSVFDLYSILPSYGESGLRVREDKNDLLMGILYDQEDTDEYGEIRVAFRNPVFYEISSVPGVPSMNVEYEGNSDIDAIVEYTDSELAKAWEKHFENRHQFSHYTIYFASENRGIVVICQDISVSIKQRTNE